MAKATVTELNRVFRYNGMDLNDPDPSMTPDEVRSFYAGVYPSLTIATVEEKVTATEIIYTFKASAGTKG